MPNAPGGVTLNNFHSHQQSCYSLVIQWNEPDNINEFDLDYYNIKMSSSKDGVAMEYALNVSSTTVEYPFELQVNSTILQSATVNMTLSAVTKCLQQGPSSAPLTIIQGTGPGPFSTPSAERWIYLNTLSIGNGVSSSIYTILNHND